MRFVKKIFLSWMEEAVSLMVQEINQWQKKLQKNARRQMAISEEIFQRTQRIEMQIKQIVERNVGDGSDFSITISREQLFRFIDDCSQDLIAEDPDILSLKNTVLQWFSIKEVAAKGEIYHPLHCVVLEGHPAVANMQEGSIIEIVQQGLFDLKRNKLLRQAKVIVAGTCTKEG